VVPYSLQHSGVGRAAPGISGIAEVRRGQTAVAK
jgi:hypothetical protein